MAMDRLLEIAGNYLPIPAKSDLIAIVFIIVVTYYYHKYIYSFWTRRGLKGPKPLPIIGNSHELFGWNRMDLEKKWVKEYGKVYGTYLGRQTRLVVADPEIVQQITVRDFHLFQNHNLSEFANTLQRSFLFFLKDEHWKKSRTLMTPTFTSGKIKRMYKLLDVCADDLVQCFTEQIEDNRSSAVVNAKDLFNLFTMDAITSCCYGLRLERSNSSDLKTIASRDDFVRAAMRLFLNPWSRIAVAICSPKPLLRLLGFQVLPDRYLEPFARRVEQMIETRHKDSASGKKFDDYLQLLIEAKLDASVELDEMDTKENHHAGLTSESILADQRRMVDEVKSSASLGRNFTWSDQEILAHAIFLLAVGLETTGTLLTNCSYALAFHPEIQEKLYGELKSIGEYNEEKTKFSFTYEKLTSCHYLDAVISETLRLLSPVLYMDRVLDSDYRIEKYGLNLSKGQVINLAYHALMNDPDYWQQPDKFDPDRFMPGNKERIVPGSYAPFGLGPRHCIGMRFSLTEAKLGLAKVMMRFRFDRAPGTRFPPPMKRMNVLTSLLRPQVTLVRRAVD